MGEDMILDDKKIFIVAGWKDGKPVLQETTSGGVAIISQKQWDTFETGSDVIALSGVGQELNGGVSKVIPEESFLFLISHPTNQGIINIGETKNQSESGDATPLDVGDSFVLAIKDVSKVWICGATPLDVVNWQFWKDE